MLSSAARTHKGNVRQLNEDAILTHSNGQLFAVADGMGGHTAGDLASQTVISELASLQFEQHHSDETLECIETCLVEVNDKINSGLIPDNDIHTNLQKKDKLIIGSTVVIAYIENDLCSCFWVGDSRLYIYRQKRLYQITNDHSLVQEMVDEGQLTQAEASHHPKANIITRAMGGNDELEVDINQFELQTGDKLLLCSDGLYNELDSDIIIESLEGENAEAIANNLLGQVLIRNAADNVSLIVIENH